MKKSMCLSACLLTVICIPSYSVKADTLGAVLNDVLHDVLVSVKPGACAANPYLLTALGKHAVAACKPVVAQCPAGATVLPISKCTLRPSAADATTLSRLKQVNGATNLGNPLEGKNINKTGLQCITDAGYSFAGTGVGYSPFCFFDMSRVETIPVGGKRWAKPIWINQNLIQMSNGSDITRSELNNPGNWVCSAANYNATARCLTLPVGFLNKLGIK